MNSVTCQEATHNAYNALIGVVEADEFVRREGRLERFLEEVGPLFIKSQVAEFLGVGLLHKHNRVENDFLMFQEEGAYENEEALMCKHTNAATLPEPVSPILCSVRADTELVGLEFSADPLVAEAHARLVKNADFVRSFHKVLDEHEMKDYLGLSITTRSFYRNRERGLIPVERSDLQQIANVIQLKRETEIDLETMIQTSWSFAAAEGSQCIPLCSSVCVPRSPGHSREHYPNHGMIA